LYSATLPSYSSKSVDSTNCYQGTIIRVLELHYFKECGNRTICSKTTIGLGFRVLELHSVQKLECLKCVYLHIILLILTLVLINPHGTIIFHLHE